MIKMTEKKHRNIRWQRIDQTEFSQDVEQHYRGSPFSLPIPNETMRAGSSIGDLGSFYSIGEAWGHVVSYFLPKDPVVLDIGCHCGKLARFLYLNPTLTYIGFDVFLPAIEWCTREFGPLVGDRFRFVHADVHSEMYNPRGKIRWDVFRFPVEDASIDMAVAASLFTHLYEPEARHYLRETFRVLKKEGKALVSIHIDVKRGQTYSGDVTKIDVDPEYFVGLAEKAGLVLSTVVGNVYGQHLLLFEKC
jgi:SAM-dependent methyltransferase